MSYRRKTQPVWYLYTIPPTCQRIPFTTTQKSKKRRGPTLVATYDTFAAVSAHYQLLCQQQPLFRHVIKCGRVPLPVPVRRRAA